MRTAEQNRKTPIATAGLFGTLRGLPGVRGSGAPSRRHRLAIAATLLVALLATLALTASPAFAAGPPVIVESSATGITETTATIQAKVNPEGFETYVYVEYGAGLATPPVRLEASETEQPVSFALNGLHPGKTYPFQVVAISSQEQVKGAASHFTTPKPPPPHAERPWWHVVSDTRPSHLPPGGVGIISVQGINVGDGPTAGSITMTDVLPEGVTVLEEEPEPGVKVPAVSFFLTPLTYLWNLGSAASSAPVGSSSTSLAFFEACKTTSANSTVTCTMNQELMEILEEGALGSPLPGAKELKGFEALEMRIRVKIAPGTATGNANRVSVTGGGAGAADLRAPVRVTSSPTPFGVEGLSLVPEEEGGAIDPQAGSHPFQLSTTFSLNQNEGAGTPPALPKDLHFKLPPGMLANVNAVPQCTDQQFQAIVKSGTGNNCPQPTAVGVVAVTVDEPITLELQTLALPLYNLTPGRGEPARFGFEFAHAPVTLDTSVRTGSDYGATVTVNNITELTNFLSTTVTVWGVPGDPRHDEARGWGCLTGGKLAEFPCQATGDVHPPPFLTLPTSCKMPLTTSVEGISWPTQAAPAGVPLEAAERGTYTLKDEFERPLALTGCNQLQFGPSIEVAPDVQEASRPSGLTVNVKVPQEVNENSLGSASSSVRGITVALPPGMALNPAGAGGLQSCSSNPADPPLSPGNQIGYMGPHAFPTLPETEPLTPETELLTFSATLPEPLFPGKNLGALGFCPNASKVATVDIASPLLPKGQDVKGAVYLASQNANPFGSLVAMYIVAEDPISGTLVKLPGRLWLCKGPGEVLAGETCATAGQIVSTFLNSPQLPFEEAKLEFFGGERAPLSTPARCGSYTTEATFVPWSAEPTNEVVAHAKSTFNITTGPNGGPCPGASLPFSPKLTGGVTNINAGGFSPLTTTIGREDGNQDMQSVTLHMPAGLEGLLSNVKLCPEQQANEGTCGAESLIGETTVSAGVGQQPVSVKGGKVYITEKYAGAPFGLSIVNPVKTGPFDLEHDTSSEDPNQNPACDCVVVRAKIEVNPITAELTVTTDPSGPHSIPHLIDGIPVQIKAVNVIVNRDHFTFNPTNCNPLSLTGTIASDEGAASPVSVPFQVTNCAALKYAPTLSVSTAAKASKTNGASLFFKIAYPKGAMGSQSWMKMMKFSIPKQLPARLTTIQKACLAHTFETNRAACPPASVIGHLLVHTEVLPVPLEGPLYFVSYGGAAFPDAVAVLHGYGLTIESHGHTFIDGKTGVTSATFEAVPDVPFESIEVSVPQGPFSEFGANLPARARGSFCGQKLVMPIVFKAQNGLEIHQNTPVGVTGCATVKTRAQKLAAALKACRNKHNTTKRRRCEKAARRAYAAPNAAHKSSSHRSHR